MKDYLSRQNGRLIVVLLQLEQSNKNCSVKENDTSQRETNVTWRRVRVTIFVVEKQ